MVWILTLLVVVTLTVGMRISASRLRKSALADLRQAEDAGSGREQDFHRNEADAKRRIAMGLGLAPIVILAKAKPNAMAMRILKGEPLPMPTKLQNVSRYTAKYSGGPNLSANLATSGAKNVIMTTATKAPMKEEVKAAVSASPARPCCAMG